MQKCFSIRPSQSVIRFVGIQKSAQTNHAVETILMWFKSCCGKSATTDFQPVLKLIGYTISQLIHVQSYHVTTQLFVNASKQKLLIIVRTHKKKTDLFIRKKSTNQIMRSRYIYNAIFGFWRCCFFFHSTDFNILYELR